MIFCLNNFHKKGAQEIISHINIYKVDKREHNIELLIKPKKLKMRKYLLDVVT